jgi:hypothetical protein
VVVKRLAALVPLLGCIPSAAEGACYLDEHCPADLACVDGFCAMPASSEESDTIPDDIRLDVGGGVPEIPSTCPAATAIRTNAGCEFWAADLPNAWKPSFSYGHDIAANQQFAVVVANVSETDNAEVSVYSGNSDSAIATATVEPLQTHTFGLPKQSLDPTENGNGVGYRIASDVPITAYQFQPLDNLVPVYSNDASALLPAHVLEDDYLAITSDANLLNLYEVDSFDEGTYDSGAYVTAIATEDDTHVVFYPTAALAPGAIEDVLLSRGETFTILSKVPEGTEPGDPYGNLSGTRVIADKPIALFSGNVVGFEPRGFMECCGDHLEHQMLPLVSWGASYICAPPPLPADITEDAPATYRITAAFDGTHLTWGGAQPNGAPSVLDANETAYFQTSVPVMVASDADHPIAVTQFLLNGGENPGNSEDGDPAMIAQPALSQLQTRYVFLAPSGYRTNVVTIVAPAGANVQLDDRVISEWRSMPDFQGSGWGFAQVSIEPGAHVLISDQPASIDVYGYDRNVSYGYAGGSAVEIISVAPPIP